MALLILRSTKLSPLTNAEIDGNFTNLNAGQTNSVVITGGSINGVAIGGSAAGEGSFTTLGVSGARTLSDTLGVTGATTLTSTLGVTGLVTLTDNLKLSAGTALLPSVYFSTNTTSGFYSSTANVIGLAISATSIGTFTSTGLNGMAIGATTRASGNFTTLDANGNVTIGDADTDTITVASSFVNGTILRSAKTATNTLSLAAYDVDGTAYTNLITLTASNTPTLTLTSTGVGTINNMSIGATTRSTGAFTTLDANGNVTLGDADTDTITVGASFVNGTILRSAKTATNTLALAAYDVDGTAYTNLITLTASNTPTLTLTSTGTGSIENMNIGATTAGTGRFSSLTATGTTTLATALGGLLKATAGVVSAATAGTDYLAPPSGTAILKANSSGALANATAGTDYIAPYGSTTANQFLGSPSGSGGTPSFRALVALDIPVTLGSTAFGSATNSTDLDATVDAGTTSFYSYIQSATATARTINISNLTSGRWIKIYLRNTNAAAKIVNIAAGTATTYTAVPLSKGDAGGASVTSVTLALGSGTAVVTVFNAGGVIGGSIS